MQVAIVFDNAGKVSLEHTVLIEDVVSHTNVCAQADPGNPGININSSNIILLAVNSIPPGTHLLACPVTDQTGSIANQSGSSQSIVGEHVGNPVNFGFAVYGSTISAKVVDLSVDVSPAGLCLAADKVVHLTAAGTGMDPIHSRIEAVTGSGGNATPVNYRAADGAEGTAGTAFSGTGSCHIIHCLSGMDMTGAPLCKEGGIHSRFHGIHLGIHAELFVGERVQHVGLIAFHISDQAHIHIYLQILRPEIVSIPVGLSCVAVHADIGIKVEYADGQGCQHSLVGLCIGTGAGNGDGCGVILGINGVASGKPIRKNHMVQFPMVDAVQVNNGTDRLNRLDIRCLQVHPVHRSAIQPVQCGITRLHLNRGSIHTGLDLDQPDHNRLVSHHIADLELHTVHAIRYSNVRNGHSAVAESKVYANPVHIGLGRGCIQTGGVGLGGVLLNGGGNIQQVAGGGNNAVLYQSGFSFIFHHVHRTEDRGLAVIHGIRVISGNVVNIDGVGAVQGAVGLPQVIGIGVGEHELDKAEVVRIVFAAVVCEVFLVVQTRDQNLGVGADINREITPAIFIRCIIDLRLVDDRHGILLVKDTVVIGVIPVQHTDPAVLILIRNIGPEANALGILHDYRLIHIQVQLGIPAGRNTLSGQSIGIQPHGAVAVMDLTVSGRGKAQFMDEALVVAIHVEVVPLLHVLSTFKVKQHLGALTQTQCGSGAQPFAMFEHRSQGTGQVSRSIRLANRGELEAIKHAKSIVGCGQRNVALFQDDLVQTAVDRCAQGDGNFLVEGDRHCLLGKGQCLGDHDLNGALAHNFFVPDHLGGSCTDLAIGSKYTIFNSAHGGISHLPDNVGRDLSGGADQIGAQSAEFHRTAGGIVVVFSGDLSTDKLSCGRSGGDDQNTVGSRTLGTIRGRAVQLQFLSGPLGQEGGRTSAVTVDSLNTTQRQHKLAHLIVGKACRIRRLAAIVHNHDDGPVGLDAHEGAGRTVCSIVIFAALVYTILDQETKVCRNDLLLPAGDGRGSGTNLGLGNIRGASNAIFLVEVDDQTSLSSTGLPGAVFIIRPVHDQVAQRLANKLRILGIVVRIVPAQAQIHSRNHVSIAIGLCVRSLL